MKPVLIDLDGTILDVRRRHHSVYSSLLAGFGKEPLGSDEFWRLRREGNSTQALLAGVLTEDERDAFSRRWLAVVETAEALALDEPFAGALEALDGMGAHYDLVLVTLRRDRGTLLSQLQSLGMAGLFRQVISVGEEPVLAKAMLPGMERVAAGGYVVGDTEADIDLAMQSERELICVGNGVRSEAFLRSRGARTVAGSLAEVARLLEDPVTRVA